MCERLCYWYGYFTVWITEYKTFIFSQSHVFCLQNSMAINTYPGVCVYFQQASRWFIYSADSFRNDTTVSTLQFSVANIATSFQKIYFLIWTKLIWCQRLICTALRAWGKYSLNHNTSIVFIWFVWWSGQTYRIIISDFSSEQIGRNSWFIWEFGCIINNIAACDQRREAT